MPLSPGQILNNRYRIVRLLGQGGFGAVYLAEYIIFEEDR
jgi:serine/threonine protein kinase